MASRKVTIYANGGTGGTSSFYYDTVSCLFYATTDFTASPISSISLPTRTGYTTLGCFTTFSPSGPRVVSPNGNLLPDFDWVPPSTNNTIYCMWTANTYELSFDYGYGEGSTQSKTVTFGSEIGSLPTPTSTKGSFQGWNVNGTNVTSSTIWSTASDATAVAQWREYHGELVDYFGAEGNLLMLVSSNPGEFRNAVYGSGSTGSGNNLRVGCLAIQTADSSKASFWRGPVLKNPTCTYRIRGSGSVSFTLGTAWNNANGKYFLTKVEYKTGADQEPLLVLSATANEGANAINLWTVNLNVSPDHVAQDPLSAISGGGEMTACTTVATAEPVVPYENGEPCASDIVHGKIVVSATTNSYFGEAAPTARSENSFIETNGVPCSMSDVDFKSYEIVAERSL